MKPVIHSEKHYIQNSLSTVASGALEQVSIAVCVDTVGTTNTDVAVGAILKAIYVEDWSKSASETVANFVFAIIKLPNGLNAPSTAQMANLNDYNNKNNIIYLTQGLASNGSTQPIPLSKGWYKIPKGKQRMSLGDKWVTVFFAQVTDQNHCGMFVFKEYL